MKVVKLHTDSQPIDQPQGSYRRAYNILLNRAKDAISNEPGFQPLYQLGKRIVYAHPIEGDRLVIFCGDFTPDQQQLANSEIGILDAQGNYDVRIVSDALKLHPDGISKVADLRNFKKELIVVWSDPKGVDRILNLDDVPFTLDGSKVLVNPEDVDLMAITPGFKTCDIDVNEMNDSGGSLSSGVYFFTGVYETEDGTLTAPGYLMGPVTVTVGSRGDSFESFNGVPAGVITNKSIKLSLSNIDTRYKWIRLIAIEKVNGNLRSYYFHREPINSATAEVIFTGNETLEDLPLEDALIEPTIYQNSKTLAYFENQLYRGNLTGNRQKEFNYQQYAKDIRIDWITDRVAYDQVEGSFKDEHIILTNKGFFPDEVYAFYIRLHFANGSRSDAFHIPGPSAADRDLEVFPGGGHSVLDTIQSLLDDGALLNYKTPYSNEATTPDKESLKHDIQIDPNVKFYQTRETALNRANDNMGVWYNEDETYPDDSDTWDTLAGQPVRHHKFPSLDVIADAGNPWLESSGRNILRLDAPKNMHIKLETNAGADDIGAAYSVPLNIKQSSDPAIQGQSFYEDDAEPKSLLLKSGVRDINNAGDSFYEQMDAQYAPLFFYNQAKSDINLRVDYDFGYIFETASDFAIGRGANLMFRVHIVRFSRNTGIFEYRPYVGSGGDARGNIESYVIDDWADVSTAISDPREFSGHFDIDLLEGDSLALVVDIFQEENTNIGISTIPINIFKADLTVTDRNASYGGDSTAPVLGIKASNIVIPAEIASDVVGYEILYAKRDLANMRVIGHAPLFGSAPHPLDYSRLGSHAGNHTSPVREGERFNNVFNPYLRDDRVRFHGFDIMQSKPAVQPAFIKVNAKMKSYLKNKQLVKDQFFDLPDAETDTALERLTQDSPVQAHYLCDFVKSNTGGENSCTEYDRLRPVGNFKYIGADVVTSYEGETLDNSYSEECALLSVKHFEAKVDTNDYEDAGVANGWLPGNANFFHWIGADQGANVFADFVAANDESILELATYYFGSLFMYKTNMYKSLFDQQLASTGKLYFTNGAQGTFSAASIFGGDTFFSLQGIRLTAAIYREDGKYGSVNKNEAVKNIFYFPCYTVANANLRNPGTTDAENFYPNVGTSYGGYREWLRRPADAVNTNQYLYNTDYSSVNDLSGAQVFDLRDEFLLEFPFRIVRSQRLDQEDKQLSVREFLSNDFKEMPKDRGAITNLEGLKNIILIHTEDALYTTASKETLSTSETQLTLGTGDIFRLEPDEPGPDTENGYAGTRHPRAAIKTPAGYLFIDAQQGKVFLFNGSLKEISAIDNFNFFRDDFKLGILEELSALNLTIDSQEDTQLPYGVGYVAGYDPVYRRLIITKRDYTLDPSILADVDVQNATFENPLLLDSTKKAAYFVPNHQTMSFDPVQGVWIGNHGYFPDVIASTRNKLFSFSASRQYLHNEGLVGVYYDAGTQSSYVDVVFNNGRDFSKLLQSLQWVSESVNANGTSEFHKTISEIWVRTPYQSSGYVQVAPKVLSLSGSNAFNAEGTWSFNAFRDLVSVQGDPVEQDFEPVDGNLDQNKPWYEQRRFVDKFFVVRFLMDNIDQNTLYLYSISASMLQSRR